MSAPLSGSADGSPIPGFYPDPSIPGYIRYWNGTSWVPGTSRPEPREGEPMPTPPSSAAAASATAPPTRAEPAPAEETGPIFLDEPGQQSAPGAAALPEVRPRADVAAREPIDWDDPGRLHGMRPESGSAWQPGPGPQSAAPGPSYDWSAQPAPGALGVQGAPGAPGTQGGPADPRSAWERTEEPTAPTADGPGAAAYGTANPGDSGRPNSPAGPASSAEPAGQGTPEGPAEGTVQMRALRRGGPGRNAPEAQPPGSGTGPPEDAGRQPPEHTVGLRRADLPLPGGRPPASGAVREGTSEQGGSPAPGSSAEPARTDRGAGGDHGQDRRLPPQARPQTPPEAQAPAPAQPAAPAQSPAPGSAGPGLPAQTPPAQTPPAQTPPAQPPGPAAPSQAQPHQAPPRVPAQPSPPPRGPAAAPAPASASESPAGVPPAGGQPSWTQQVHDLAAGPQGAGGPDARTPWRPPADNPFLRAAAGHQARPAGLGKRFAARLVDAAVTGAVVGAVAFPFVGPAVQHIQDKIDAVRDAGRTEQVWLIDGTTGGYLAVVLGAFLLFGILYEALPTWRWGRTLGKKLCGLRVLTLEQQEVPGFGAALRRWLVYGVLSVLAVGVLNVLWCFFDRPWRQCWHDKLAGTFVSKDSGEIRL